MVPEDVFLLHVIIFCPQLQAESMFKWVFLPSVYFEIEAGVRGRVFPGRVSSQPGRLREKMLDLLEFMFIQGGGEPTQSNITSMASVFGFSL